MEKSRSHEDIRTCKRSRKNTLSIHFVKLEQPIKKILNNPPSRVRSRLIRVTTSVQEDYVMGHGVLRTPKGQTYYSGPR